ncbi:MAG TPA: 3'-5' exonuclease [Holophaga sp.]|nr:3'-5' exonuclease [Holophaga sp.]
MEKPTFALDLETTGLDPHRDGVLEAGLTGARAYDCLVSDAPPSAPAARAAHGITPQMARRLGKPGRVVLSELLDVLGPGPVKLVAHNAAFDRSFLEAWAGREGLRLPEIAWTCTLTEARELCPSAAVSRSLGSLAGRFGWHTERLHRARADAALALRLHGALSAWRDIRNRLDGAPRVVYLAGPLRGDGVPRSIHHNRERMLALAQWVQGVLPEATLVVPHGNFAFLDESGDRGLEVRERALASCARLLERCDALVLCGELSPGMVHEREVAERCGLPWFAAPGWDPPEWLTFQVPAVA